MEFGKVDPAVLQNIDFSLPADGQHIANVLTGNTPDKAACSIGAARWGCKEWLGYLYPPKTKEVNFLQEYVRHFNAIELNTAYHAIPSLLTVRKWKKIASAHPQGNFLFCPKFPQQISHDQRLVAAGPATDEFIKTILELDTHLGASFLQLSEHFGPEQYPVLKSYLAALPPYLKVFVELRHAQWFDHPGVRKVMLETLSQLQKGIVITDVAGRRDLLHMELTIPEVFIRFIGNGKSRAQEDHKRIDQWASRLALWQSKGLKHIYFFVHQENERDTLSLANYTIRTFNEKLGLQLPPIVLLPSLFGDD